MMRETEVHKFSYGTLTRILEKMDYMIKEYELFKFNPRMENRIWTEDDKRRMEGYEISTTDSSKEQNDLIIPVLRSDTYAGNPVKEILLNLNLPDHKSVLTEPKVHSSATLILKRSSLKSLCVQDEAILGR
ncbi:hypothetical protein Tco_0677639 [Tanacetum coccineum]|uniref:Uncharacterized protein n=1 Tax=Tanacetum coccineum TaxID=301880 RepID=A0ABQ4XCS1_9ASTR